MTEHAFLKDRNIEYFYSLKVGKKTCTAIQKPWSRSTLASGYVTVGYICKGLYILI